MIIDANKSNEKRETMFKFFGDVTRGVVEKLDSIFIPGVKERIRENEESTKRHEESTKRLNEETAKINAETAKINAETEREEQERRAARKRSWW